MATVLEQCLLAFLPPLSTMVALVPQLSSSRSPFPSLPRCSHRCGLCRLSIFRQKPSSENDYSSSRPGHKILGILESSFNERRSRGMILGIWWCCCPYGYKIRMSHSFLSSQAFLNSDISNSIPYSGPTDGLPGGHIEAACPRSQWHHCSRIFDFPN